MWVPIHESKLIVGYFFENKSNAIKTAPHTKRTTLKACKAIIMRVGSDGARNPIVAVATLLSELHICRADNKIKEASTITEPTSDLFFI